MSYHLTGRGYILSISDMLDAAKTYDEDVILHDAVLAADYTEEDVDDFTDFIDLEGCIDEMVYEAQADIDWAQVDGTPINTEAGVIVLFSDGQDANAEMAQRLIDQYGLGGELYGDIIVNCFD